MTLQQWLRQLNPLAEVGTTRLAQDTPDWLFRSEVFRGSHEQRFRLGSCADNTFSLLPKRDGGAHPTTETCVISLRAVAKLARFCYLVIHAITLPWWRGAENERHFARERQR